MKYARLATRLYNTPLLISEAKADVLAHLLWNRSTGMDAAAPDGEVRPDDPHLTELYAAAGFTRVQRGGYMASNDGVALIQVLGTLIHRGSWMDAESGLTSYQALQSQLEAAISDPMIRGILLEIDSPGGEAAGMFEFAKQIRAAADQKPIVAHANEEAFSAAFGLAVAATEFYAAPNGMVGSIGVILMHVDQSKMDEKRGLVYTPITYGKKKAQFSSHEPLSDTALKDATTMVDRLGETFVTHVGTMRGVDAQVARDTEAGLLHPDSAMNAGLIDGDANMQDALARLRTIISRPKSNGQRAAAGANFPTTGVSTMTTKTDAPAPATGPTLEEQTAAARAAGKAEGEANAAKAAADAVAADRARSAAIMAHPEAVGRQKLATFFATQTALTVDEIGKALAAAEKEGAAASTTATLNPLEKEMSRRGNPAVGGGNDPEKKTATVVNTSEIYANARKQEAAARAAHRGAVANPLPH